MRFKDPSHQQSIEEKGYVVIKNLLPEVFIEEASHHYFEVLKEDYDFVFYTSNWIKDSAQKKKVHSFLNPKLTPIIHQYVEAAKDIYSYYLIKKPGEGGKVELHQDWSLVDESQTCGMNVWIPLIDITPQIGPFQVLTGSHKIYNNLRGSNIEFPYRDYRDLMEERFLTDVYVDKGDAIFFDHRLVHSSPPNKTDKVRLALGHVLVPDDAHVVHYYAESGDDSVVTMYNVPDDFLLNFSYGDSIKGFEPVKRVPLDKGQLTAEDLKTSFNAVA